MIRISIEGQGGTLEEAAADLSKTAVAFIKRAQESQEAEAPAKTRKAKPAPAPKAEGVVSGFTPDPSRGVPSGETVGAPDAIDTTKPAAPAEPVVSAKMVNQARDQAVAYAEAKGPKALQALLTEFKIKRVSELAKADYPRWIEATTLKEPEAEEVVEGEDLLK